VAQDGRGVSCRGLPRCRDSRLAAAGFTLIELVIALAVVAILCAIAWPGYGAVMHRAQRTEARLALLDLQHAEERHYMRHFAYTDRLEEATSAGGLGKSARTATGAYALSIALREDGQGYVAQAIAHPQGRQARDWTCASFTMDETGQRSARDADGRDTTAACWR
jgi:type IV pilus assembly protein PilE